MNMNSINGFTSSHSLLIVMWALSMYLSILNSSLRVRCNFFPVLFLSFPSTIWFDKTETVKATLISLFLFWLCMRGRKLCGLLIHLHCFQIEKQMLCIVNNNSQNHSLLLAVKLPGLFECHLWVMKVQGHERAGSLGHQRRKAVTIMSNCS